MEEVNVSHHHHRYHHHQQHQPEQQDHYNRHARSTSTPSRRNGTGQSVSQNIIYCSFVISSWGGKLYPSRQSRAALCLCLCADMRYVLMALSRTSGRLLARDLFNTPRHQTAEEEEDTVDISTSPPEKPKPGARRQRKYQPTSQPQPQPQLQPQLDGYVHGSAHRRMAAHPSPSPSSSPSPSPYEQQYQRTPPPTSTVRARNAAAAGVTRDPDAKAAVERARALADIKNNIGGGGGGGQPLYPSSHYAASPHSTYLQQQQQQQYRRRSHYPINEEDEGGGGGGGENACGNDFTSLYSQGGNISNTSTISSPVNCSSRRTAAALDGGAPAANTGAETERGRDLAARVARVRDDAYRLLLLSRWWWWLLWWRNKCLVGVFHNSAAKCYDSEHWQFSLSSSLPPPPPSLPGKKFMLTNATHMTSC